MNRSLLFALTLLACSSAQALGRVGSAYYNPVADGGTTHICINWGAAQVIYHFLGGPLSRPLEEGHLEKPMIKCKGTLNGYGNPDQQCGFDIAPGGAITPSLTTCPGSTPMKDLQTLSVSISAGAQEWMSEPDWAPSGDMLWISAGAREWKKIFASRTFEWSPEREDEIPLLHCHSIMRTSGRSAVQYGTMIDCSLCLNRTGSFVDCPDSN